MPAIEPAALGGFARRRALRGALPLLLCLLAFALYWGIATHLMPSALLGHGPFGSDTRTSAHDFLQLRYEWKHPLMSPVEFAVTQLFLLAPGVVPITALTGAVAVLASLNVLLVFLCLRRVPVGSTAAWLGAALYAVGFVNLCVLGVPESYTVSSLATLLFLLAWIGPQARDRRCDRLLLGLLAGLAGLANLPLLLLAALPGLRALCEGRPRRALAASLTVGPIALAMVLAAAIAYGLIHRGAAGSYFVHASDYAGAYGTASRWLLASKYLDVLSCFFLFAVASPLGDAQSLTAGAAAGYLGGVLGALGALAALSLAGAALAGLAGRHARITLPLVAWSLALCLFYVFFKPIHAMVYAVQAQPALAIMATLGLAPALRRGPAPRAALAGLVLILLVANLSAPSLGLRAPVQPSDVARLEPPPT
jgi:hypothetical protein